MVNVINYCWTGMYLQEHGEMYGTVHYRWGQMESVVGVQVGPDGICGRGTGRARWNLQ
jgi:hypothetical protein